MASDCAQAEPVSNPSALFAGSSLQPQSAISSPSLPASIDARRGSVKGRAAAFVVRLIAVAGLALLAFLGEGLRCDESCNGNLVQQDRSPGWWNSANT